MKDTVVSYVHYYDLDVVVIFRLLVLERVFVFFVFKALQPCVIVFGV